MCLFWHQHVLTHDLCVNFRTTSIEYRDFNEGAKTVSFMLMLAIFVVAL